MITAFQLYCEMATEYKEGNLKVIYRDDKLTIAIPKNLKSSQITCRGTKWCTAEEEEYQKWSMYNVLFRFLFHDGYKLRLTWNFVDGTDGTWGSGGEKYYEMRFENNPFNYSQFIENIKRSSSYLDTYYKKYEDLINDKKKYDPEEYQEEVEDCKETIERFLEIIETKKQIAQKIKIIPKKAIQKVIEYREQVKKSVKIEA